MSALDKSGTLYTILKMLVVAPESQLSTGLAEEAKNLANNEETTAEQIHQFFEKVSKSCCESSQFVKELVNPFYTSKY